MKTIIINGMSCQKCVDGVTKALNTMDGITHIDVIVGKALVDGSVTDADLKETIEDFGFDVVSITE